jgi:hypothetical protein
VPASTTCRAIFEVFHSPSTLLPTQRNNGDIDTTEMERPKTSRGKQHPSPDEFTDYVVPSPMNSRLAATASSSSDYVPIHPSLNSHQQESQEVHTPYPSLLDLPHSFLRRLLKKTLTLVNSVAGCLLRRSDPAVDAFFERSTPTSLLSSAPSYYMFKPLSIIKSFS